MSEFQFAKPEWVHLFWAAPFVVLLVLYGNVRRGRRLHVFGLDLRRVGDWLRAVCRRRLWRATLLALALVGLTAAALQPRANPQRRKIKTAARDLAVCLDVSRSMLAEDIAPSRLERAKLELSRLADQLASDRIGLVVFAGDAVITCPLTSNTSYFKSVLKTVSTRATGQGGTKIGDAVRKALGDLLGLDTEAPTTQPTDAEQVGSKPTFADILLITDGEDHDSYPTYAAKQAAALDVGIYTVGLGSSTGSPIPIAGSDGVTRNLEYQGQTVMSKLDGEVLTEMALTGSRGAYLPAGTANFDLVDFYRSKIVAQQPRRQMMVEQVVWREIYQPVLFVALALLLASLLWPERPGQPSDLAGEATA